MAFKPPAEQPDFSSLLTSLAQSNLKKKDEQTYQTIRLIIEWLMQFQNLTTGDVSEIENLLKTATFVTYGNDTIKLPNSKKIVSAGGINLYYKPFGQLHISTALPIADFFYGDSDQGGIGSIDGAGGSGAAAGAPGPPGATGAQGNQGPPGIDGNCYEELYPVILPGPAGANGAAGAAGTNGAQGQMGPPGFDAEDPEPVYAIPGPAGTNGTSGSSFTLTDFTKDLGTARSGTFDITGLAGLTTDKNVLVVQTAQKIASKGDARDEFEMNPIVVTGYVVDAATIRCYWYAKDVVVGTYAFAYMVAG